jgi:hypothetical protein
MATCCATLSRQQRRILRALLTQESEIATQYNRHISQLSTMLNTLQLIHHEDDLEQHTNKCNEFIQTCTRLDMCTKTYEIIPGATQLAMTCSCICIQAACFRMLYKWIPRFDVLQMKLLKIKTICEKKTSTSVIQLCADIEKTIQNVLKSQTTSH